MPGLPSALRATHFQTSADDFRLNQSLSESQSDSVSVTLSGYH
jgi:hypothetical protein